MYLHFRKSALPPYQHVMQISGCMQLRATSLKLAHCTPLERVQSRFTQCIPRKGCCACSKSATMHSIACLTHAMIAPTVFFLSPVTQDWWQQIAGVHAMHADANACSCTTDTSQRKFCLQRYISTCERRDMGAFEGHFTVTQPSQALLPAHRTTMLPQPCLTAKAAIL